MLPGSTEHALSRSCCAFKPLTIVQLHSTLCCPDMVAFAKPTADVLVRTGRGRHTNLPSDSGTLTACSADALDTSACCDHQPSNHLLCYRLVHPNLFHETPSGAQRGLFQAGYVLKFDSSNSGSSLLPTSCHGTSQHAPLATWHATTHIVAAWLPESHAHFWPWRTGLPDRGYVAVSHTSVLRGVQESSIDIVIRTTIHHACRRVLVNDNVASTNVKRTIECVTTQLKG
jgi:hypothetical protein